MASALTPHDLMISVDKAFREPGVPEALRDVHIEKLGRRINVSSPQIALWKAVADDREYFPLKPPPGSIGIYWSHGGSTLIRDLEVAHIARDRKALELLSSQVVTAWKKRRVRSIPEAAKLEMDAPVLFDVR